MIICFEQDAFFQPYMPLQQIDLLSKPSYLCGKSHHIRLNLWLLSLFPIPSYYCPLLIPSLCPLGTTNSILTHQRSSIDLIINVETNTFEFLDPVVERLVSLTPADRKWMDDVVNDVEESWNEGDPGRPIGMQ